MNKLKKLILGGVLAGAGFVSGIYTERATRSLENRIKHQEIARIETYNPENTNKYIIWVKQEHGLFGDHDNTEENERLQKVEECQAKIYRILKHLKYSAEANIVYNEGYTKEDEKSGRLRRIADNPRYPHLCGGAVKLAREEIIELRPAETEEMNRKGIFELSKLVIGEPTPYLMGGRERTAVELIGRDNPRIAVLVYGAKHEFKDDVERWNRENPDRKYSLIEVTPEGLE